MSTLLTGRDLDAQIAERLMGWTAIHQDGDWVGGLDPTGWTAGIPYYSSDIAAAWQVIEHLCATRAAHWTLTVGPDGTMASVSIWQGGICAAGAPAATVPLAICRTALKALGEPQ